MVKSFPNEEKTMSGKEKLLVTSNSSFSYSVFKRLVLQTHKNQGLFGKGLIYHVNILKTLPKNKTLASSKLKAFADDKLNVPRNTTIVFHRIENRKKKRENANYQHFLLFPQCFQKGLSSVAVKSRQCEVNGYNKNIC